MRTLTLILSLLICFGLGEMYAQRTMLPSNPGVVVSYFGDRIINPGGSIGMDYPLIIWENRKEVPTKNGGYNRTRSTQLLGQSFLGFYNSPNDHNAFFFRLEAGYRNIHHRSTFGSTAIRLDLTGGATFLRFGQAGDGSEASDRTPLAGSGRIFPTVSLALAQDYKISAYIFPISFFVKGNLMVGNQSFYPSMEVGFVFRGLGLLDILPKKVNYTRN